MRYIILSVFTFLSFATKAQTTTKTIFTYDSVVMGKDFKNQVFYKMKDGSRNEITKTNWDIMFSTNTFGTGTASDLGSTTSIWINAQSGVELYTYPKGDTLNYATVDTTGMYKWKKMYNSDQSYSVGAFNRGKNTVNAFDFGWGIYGFFANDHTVTGDSIFVIKCNDGSVKKLWIHDLHRGVWKFKYANLDGSNPYSVSIDKKDSTYGLLNFTHFSLVANKLYTYEPKSTTWDLCFTPYQAKLADGTVEVRVGALTNSFSAITSAQTTDTVFATTKAPTAFNTVISELGYDWNDFTYKSTGPITVKSPIYWVKSDTTYPIQFVSMDAETGLVKFIRKAVVTTENSLSNTLVNKVVFYPNPANTLVNILANEASTASIYNQNGQEVLRQNLVIGNNQLDINSLTAGVYTIKTSNAQTIAISKLTICR